MKHLEIRFGEIIGPVKQVNGVNCGSLTRNLRDDARPWFKEAMIPLAHLHDCENPYGSGEFVDVDCIFKTFKCDPDDPECYNFGLTDEYLKAIDECGTRIIYRLGTAIEIGYKLHTKPPKDYLKWARIVEHIIMHYNEGWANGMHLGIKDWEIWSEPDTRNIWDGEWEEFFEFYKVTATYLKNRFPDLNIGGSDICNIEGGFLRQFLTYMTKDGSHVPYDFCSYQCYSIDPHTAAQRAEFARNILNEFGYTNTEVICSEWNYVRTWEDLPFSFVAMKDERGAAYNASQLCALQNSVCSRAAYYVSHPRGGFCGLFRKGNIKLNGAVGVVERTKAYYAFKAFAELVKQGSQVRASIEEGNVYVCAAAGEKKVVLLANFHETECLAEKIRLRFADDGSKTFSVYRTDRRHTEELVGTVKNGDVLSLPAYSLALLIEE